MKTRFIRITDFCESHNVEESFIIELKKYELVRLKNVGKEQFILPEELPEIEMMLRLHRDLKINIEGIEAIRHLLERTTQLQEEIRRLRNRLNGFENL